MSKAEIVKSPGDWFSRQVVAGVNKIGSSEVQDTVRSVHEATKSNQTGMWPWRYSAAELGLNSLGISPTLWHVQ